MENTAIFLIIVALFLLAIILGLLVIVIFKVLRQNPSTLQVNKEDPPQTTSETSSKKYHPAVLERMKEAEKFKFKRAQLFCPNHPDEPGETPCGICDRLFCKSCIRPFKNLHFCLEHLHLVMNHEWDEVITIKTSTHDPERGVRLYEDKKSLFEKEAIPTYIETHYKINVDEDYIETYLVLYGIAEQIKELRTKFDQDMA